MRRSPNGPPGDVELARVVRDGVCEAVHRGRVAVARPGRPLVGLGDLSAHVYPRSAVKPAQAAAAVDVVDGLLGWDRAVVDPVASLAIGSASHDGGSDHQVEAAYLLAAAGLDEDALRCPPAWPWNAVARTDATEPVRLAHGCSGKHALLLWAHVLLGDDPRTYLDAESTLSHRVRERLTAWSSEEPGGPGVDGCGAPAWTLSLGGLARMTGFLAAGSDPTAREVARAMTTRPDLVGGLASDDTRLMLAAPGIVAKRGAEGVLAAGTSDGTGVAVKVSDGSARATLPVVASVLRTLGVAVPDDLCTRVVLGGGQLHGAVEVPAELLAEVIRR